MREWKIAKTYNVLDYLFCVAVATDDPHVLGVLGGNEIALTLIYTTHYKEESEIDYFATVTVPMVIRSFLMQKTGASHKNFKTSIARHQIKNKMMFMKREKIIEYLNQTHKWTSLYAITDEMDLTVQETKALLKVLEIDGRVLKERSPAGIYYFRTP